MKLLITSITTVGLLMGQAQNPTQTKAGSQNQVVTLDSQPLYRVTVVSRTAKAINYRHRGGATKIDFRGTALMPEARGEAKVESKQGYIEVEVEFDDINRPASQFGPEYLTYVMWAISPEGRATNLGEVLLNGNKSKLNVTTELQTFGLVVTAEPYFAVSQPSDVVVMENVVRSDTAGKVDIIDAKYELLQRGQYTFNADRSALKVMSPDPSSRPLDLLEARNAVQIARWAGADKYASDTFAKAEESLKRAEDYHVRKQRKPTSTASREAVQVSEDARLITLRRIEEERLANERRAAAEREAAERAKADESARLRAQAEEQRRLEEQRRASAEASAALEAQKRALADAERLAAEKARTAAEQERLAAEKAKAEALAAQQAAVLEQQKLAAQAAEARNLAAAAERARLTAEQDKENLRKQLLEQFNLILETRDSARGLIVNMSDVLFDTAKYTLRPLAREKLARVSGIVLSHPGLMIEVEGHTDSVGSDEYNQRLSEQRAASVRDYMVSQGLNISTVTAKGFGETTPVASNDNAKGRQQNRRVELVVSGEVIGTKLSDIRPSTNAVPPPAPR
jgi:outer membrane protein OmpA-like peptidoglycan-associated protein